MQTTSPISSFDTFSPTVVAPQQTSGALNPESNLESPLKLIRVLHVINGEHFSGAERVQQQLGRALPEFAVEAHFACVKPGKFPEMCGLAQEQVVQFPMRGRLDWAVVGKLCAYVRQNEIEILHAHTPRTALVTALVSLRTGTPWCYHVHSPTARDSTRGVLNRLNLLMERTAIRTCTQLITVSKSLRREMLRLGVPKTRLSVVPNGVPAIEPIDPNQRLDSQTWRLGLIALMRPRKGVEVALQAMSQLKNSGAKVELELIGGFETAEYEKQITNLIQQLNVADCVRWTGFTKDIASAVRRLDALVLPSLFGEGMPMVVLEALAAGVPVVATRVEGTPEVVRDGVEGLLAEPGSSSDLANQISLLTGSRVRWAEMSSRALSRHREHFSETRMASKVAKIYRRIVDTL